MPPVNTADDFWALVTIAGEDECWLWTGGVKGHPDWQPYGLYRLSRITTERRAHRIAWVLTFGEIPKGLQVLHKCDTPLCCNPWHLFLGTNQDNMDDRNRKGRQARGRQTKNTQGKLTITKVLLIRRLSARGVQNVDLARRFGVSKQTVTKVVRGQTWQHIGGPITNKYNKE